MPPASQASGRSAADRHAGGRGRRRAGRQRSSAANAAPASAAPTVNVEPGPKRSHARPASRFAGSAAKPVSPLNQPSARPRAARGTRSTDERLADAVGRGRVHAVEQEEDPGVPALVGHGPADVDEREGRVARQQHRHAPPPVAQRPQRRRQRRVDEVVAAVEQRHRLQPALQPDRPQEEEGVRGIAEGEQGRDRGEAPEGRAEGACWCPSRPPPRPWPGRGCARRPTPRDRGAGRGGGRGRRPPRRARTRRRPGAGSPGRAGDPGGSGRCGRG